MSQSRSQSTLRRLSRWGSAFLALSLVPGCATKSSPVEASVQEQTRTQGAERLEDSLAASTTKETDARFKPGDATGTLLLAEPVAQADAPAGPKGKVASPVMM